MALVCTTATPLAGSSGCVSSASSLTSANRRRRAGRFARVRLSLAFRVRFQGGGKLFNVGIGEIAVIVLVCLIVFGPERLPQMARQIGRFLGQLRLTTQSALDQLKQEADLKDINLPDLRVGSLRTQAREREEIKASLEAGAEPNGSAGNGSSAHPPASVGPGQDAAASKPAPVDP